MPHACLTLAEARWPCSHAAGRCIARKGPGAAAFGSCTGHVIGLYALKQGQVSSNSRAFPIQPLAVNPPFSKMHAGVSKLCASLYTRMLAEQLRAQGVAVNACCPG